MPLGRQRHILHVFPQRPPHNDVNLLLQECDIYLLDDVLAAVDASVAALLWERAICGLLQSKTRLVSASHALHHRTSRIWCSVLHMRMWSTGHAVQDSPRERLSCSPAGNGTASGALCGMRMQFSSTGMHTLMRHLKVVMACP